MASLPKPDLTPRFMSLEELLAIKGTPEFEAEYRRQMEFIAEHDRRTNNADRMEPDEEDLAGWI